MPRWSIHIIITLLMCLLAIFALVMVSDIPTHAFHFFGVKDKFKILEFLGVSMGIVLLALQATISHIRAKAMEDTARAHAKANMTLEKGQQQERLKNAVEHLGNKSESVRLGGAYELFHLAKEVNELRKTALDILCAHIRGTTGENEYRNKHKKKPSEEIQSLLTLIFVQEYEIFKGLRADLRASWLNGADLWYANLNRADLWKVHLSEAGLLRAKLQGAILMEADLKNAQLYGADLREAFV